MGSRKPKLRLVGKREGGDKRQSVVGDHHRHEKNRAILLNGGWIAAIGLLLITAIFYSDNRPTSISSGFPGSVWGASDLDCSDFPTRAAAQRFFNEHEPGDPHRLDADNDGRACE